LSRNASAPAARDAASSSPRPDTPMIAMRPSGGPSARIRLMASIPSMPGSTMSINTASKEPCAIR
jgi:hypothetical protein